MQGSTDGAAAGGDLGPGGRDRRRGAQRAGQRGVRAAYPVWSTLIIALDIIVIYAIAVHGAEAKYFATDLTLAGTYPDIPTQG